MGAVQAANSAGYQGLTPLTEGLAADAESTFLVIEWTPVDDVTRRDAFFGGVLFN